ncbi:outer membrane porin GjpA [[Mycobacterium] vasticus]|uniref:Outer membrane porin GjpA n=1 Tax=[Mycobacterium] vasticus TaxID=2875777 RepID=A0ABU5YSP7_9MYCO|nr:outer membrane porin GjpA [Mycolicibacter sp. MYC017]MEB3067955.1 outer membrane porin GjpA [Mycolicibacter sp. MYC017]
MQHAIKPYATAGVAIVGAGLIAAAPAVTPLPQVHTWPDLSLTADSSPLGDLSTPWTDVFNTASDNLDQLTRGFLVAPFVGFQQAMANLNGFMQQIQDDPSTTNAVIGEIQTQLKAALSSMTLMNADQDTVNAVIHQTMDGSALGGHSLIFGQIPGFLPPEQADSLAPIINFLGSPMSAVMMGAIGPSIAPWVAMMNSITEGDSFNEILASWLNGFLNGATLNLDSLLPAINGAGLLPETMSVTHMDIAFGGLLSTGGHVSATPIDVVDADGNTVTTVDAIGGSMFNSIGLGLSGIPILNNLTLESDAIGPLGAWIGLSQVIGAQLGWGTGWTGKGAPEVPLTPPGSDLGFPTLPEFDDGGSSVATDFDFSGFLDSLGF